MWLVDEYNARLGCFLAKNILFMRGEYIFYLFIASLSLSLSLSNVSCPTTSFLPLPPLFRSSEI